MRHHAHLGECLGNLIGLEIGECQLLDVQVEIGIAHDSCHLARKECVVFMVGKVFQLLALELVEVLVDALKVAIGLQHGSGLLVADAGNTGDVIGFVALQAQEVGELAGLHTVTFLDFGRTVNYHVSNAALGGYDAGKVACQLVGVFIAGNQQRLIAQLLVAGGNSAQDVVALPAGKSHNGNVHGSQQLFHHRKLDLQILIHGRTLGFVLLQSIDTELRAAPVKSAYQRIGLLGFDELEQHGEEPKRRVSGGAIGRRHGRRYRMVGTMHERVSIDNGYGFGHEGSSRVRTLRL